MMRPSPERLADIGLLIEVLIPALTWQHSTILNNITKLDIVIE